MYSATDFLFFMKQINSHFCTAVTDAIQISEYGVINSLVMWCTIKEKGPNTNGLLQSSKVLYIFIVTFHLLLNRSLNHYQSF